MVYIGFSEYGYECFDAGHYLLFSENNSHELLFYYVAQDFSCLPKLFDQYISQRMDTSTFTLHDCPDGKTAIEDMKRVLMAAHPYYKYEVKDVLIRAIGDYFSVAIPGFSEEWYIERITALLEPLLVLGDTYPQDFYNKYQKQVGGDAYSAGWPDSRIETFIYDIPREMPTGLNNEVRTQCEIYNMLYFLLDILAHGLDKLTTSQRIWLYSNIMANSGAGLTVPKHLCLKHPTLYRDGNDYSQFVEYNRELDDKFHPLYVLSKMNVGCNGVPTDMETDMRAAIDYAKVAATTEFYETYEISSLYQLLYLEVWSMVQDKVKIRKCKRCSKYFVVANRKIAYCDREDESGLRCTDVGPRQAFQEKMKNDEPLKIYNRAYKTHYARTKKGTMTKTDFVQWADEAKLKLEKVRVGELDIASFQEWLRK